MIDFLFHFICAGFSDLTQNNNQMLLATLPAVLLTFLATMSHNSELLRLELLLLLLELSSLLLELLSSEELLLELLSSEELLLELLSSEEEELELLLDDSSSELDEDEDEDLPERPGALAIFSTAPARFLTSSLIFSLSAFTLPMAFLQPSGQFLAASAALFFSSAILRSDSSFSF